MKELNSVSDLERGDQFRFIGGNEIYEFQYCMDHYCVVHQTSSDGYKGFTNVWVLPKSVLNYTHIEKV